MWPWIKILAAIGTISWYVYVSVHTVLITAWVSILVLVRQNIPYYRLFSADILKISTKHIGWYFLNIGRWEVPSFFLDPLYSCRLKRKKEKNIKPSKYMLWENKKTKMWLKYNREKEWSKVPGTRACTSCPPLLQTKLPHCSPQLQPHYCPIHLFLLLFLSPLFLFFFLLVSSLSPFF